MAKPTAVVMAVAAVAAIAAAAIDWNTAAGVDVAPLSRVTLDGTAAGRPLAADLHDANPLPLVDGLGDYVLFCILPPTAAPRHMDFQLPAAFSSLKVAAALLRGDGQWRLNLEARSPGEAWRDVKPTASILPRGGDPFVRTWQTGRAAALRLAWQGTKPTHWASFQVLAQVPRPVARLYAALLGIGWPWAFGVALAAGLLQAGEWSLALCRRKGSAAGNVVAGILAGALAGGAWCAAPRGVAADAGFGALALAAAGWGLLRSARGRAPAGFAGVPVTVFVLLAGIAADTFGLTNGAAAPADHFLVHYGAWHLAEGFRMPADLANRPWLLQALYAPFERLLPIGVSPHYLGSVAGANALALPLLEAVLAARCGAANARRAAALLLLLPCLANFHCYGQRLLAAGLGLVALERLLAPATRRRTLGGGIALALGIGIHPSIAFLLPGLALVAFLRPVAGGIAGRLANAARCVGLAGFLYAVWLAAIGVAYPGGRNDLLYYPFKNRWQDPVPAGQSVLDYARARTPGDWRQLAWNRANHLQHYLRTNTRFRNSPHTMLRWIDLPNVVGWTGLPVLAVALWRRRRDALAATAIFLPLLIHHLHIGDADAQFHISPTPFVALAALVAGAWPRVGWWRWPMLAEWALRSVFPLFLAWTGRMDQGPLLESLRLLPNDPLAVLAFSALPALAWAAAARRTLHSSASPENIGRSEALLGK